MRVIQINVVYNTGSTGRIVSKIHEFLSNRHIDSYVFYGRGKRYKKINVFKISSEFEAKIHSFLSKLFGKEFGFSFFSTLRCINLIKKIKPDVVHLHCLNGHFINVYKLVSFLKRNHIKTVLTLHAEIMHTAGCSHALKCEKFKTTGCQHCKIDNGYISRFFGDDSKKSFLRIKKSFSDFPELIVVGCSNWMTERAKSSIIFKNSCCVCVQNGIDLIDFKRSSLENINAIKKKLNILSKKIILNVTSDFYLDIKGSDFFVQIAKSMPDYQFVVVGSPDKIHINNIMFIDHTESVSELCDYYSCADCFAITSLCETFPTVCLEAISCGLCVVGFNVGGIPETIPDGCGECVKAYSVDLFVDALRFWSNKKAKLPTGIVKSFNEMGKEYLKIYEE